MTSRNRLGRKLSGKRCKRADVIRGQLSSFRRIAVELFGLEIGGKHIDYKSSGIGLPCASEAENPSMEPSVGTRSVDSVGRS